MTHYLDNQIHILKGEHAKDFNALMTFRYLAKQTQTPGDIVDGIIRMEVLNFDENDL